MFGGISFYINDSEALFTNEIISIALLIGVISSLITTWKINVVKKIPENSVGVIFGMMSVFHVIIESILRGYIVWNMVVSVILMIIAISMVFNVNIRTAIFESIMYCLSVSFIRNLEFSIVYDNSLDPFLWMSIISIPSLLMYLIMRNKIHKKFDDEAKKIAILWVFLPPLYHYVIVSVSPTMAALAVTAGYVLYSSIHNKSRKGYAAAFISIVSSAIAIGV